MSFLNDHILVIFGASGDLAQKKLIPAIYHQFRQHFFKSHSSRVHTTVPKQKIIGVGRKQMSDDDFRKHINTALKHETTLEPESLAAFMAAAHYHTMQEYHTPSHYQSLSDKIHLILKTHHMQQKNILYYLATPPKLYYIIPEQLSQKKLNDQTDGFKHLVIEKPFGHDFKSASQLNTHLLKFFTEKQLFRIDHYLGKEAVQNLLIFRFANIIYQPIWNNAYIDSVHIRANEIIGIEQRGEYYDHTGALKDMIQNHLLQLLGLVALEPPKTLNAKSIRDAVFNTLQSIRIYKSKPELQENVLFAQYKGYLQEKNVSQNSKTETFASVRLFIDNERWKGVPFALETGKCLHEQVSEIIINFKKTPHLFEDTTFYNQLIIRIQPNEGIHLKFAVKKPGAGFEYQKMDMNFCYSSFKAQPLQPPYERLILDAISGDNTLFSRNDTVEACWKIIDPIHTYIKKHPNDLQYYEKGSQGLSTTFSKGDSMSHSHQLTCKEHSS